MGTTNLDALTCSGTVTAAKLSISGTATRGSRVISTGGSSTITYSGIPAKTTPLFITGRSASKLAKAVLMTQTAGVAKVGLFTAAGTAATGSVHWAVI